ncbi:MAG TPA: RpiB/LacA/LacB family sugar-phosphate isomerase [Pyrinomonadaceae bacterium]|jgi:ribose 5-phosphate isomerase B|nr:RpiB/LacA/LacB family sugar-phosphate isomerase [Pyrinomonadaceae bacterium]
MSPDKASREKIKEMVREALAEATRYAEPEHVKVNSIKERSEREFERDESAKNLITEDDIRGLSEGDRLRIAEGAKFTPLAKDLIKEKKIELIIKKPRNLGLKVKRIAIGADHGGFEIKGKLVAKLEELGLHVRDHGTQSSSPVDYPDIAHSVARAVANGQADAGILIDGAGIGSAIAANKLPGIRAAACYNIQLARNAREHNGANILTLGAGQNSLQEMIEICEVFLTSELTEERHLRRVNKIESIDKQYGRSL